MNIQSVIDQPLSPGIVSIDMAGQVFTHKLRHTPLSPADNAVVLDLASPLYNPGAVIDGVSKIYDRSGNGNHGTITDATWGRNGRGLSYLSFNGTSSNVDLGKTLAQLGITTEFTIIAWVKSDDPTSRDVIFGALHTDGSGNVSLEYNTSQYYLNVNTSAGSSVTTRGGTTDALPHCVVAKYDGTNQFLYIDGEFLDSDGNTGTIDVLASTAHIGQAGEYVGAAIWWNGYIALFRIFNSPLSVTEIAHIYNEERHLFGV